MLNRSGLIGHDFRRKSCLIALLLTLMAIITSIPVIGTLHVSATTSLVQQAYGLCSENTPSGAQLSGNCATISYPTSTETLTMTFVGSVTAGNYLFYIIGYASNPNSCNQGCGNYGVNPIVTDSLGNSYTEYISTANSGKQAAVIFETKSSSSGSDALTVHVSTGYLMGFAAVAVTSLTIQEISSTTSAVGIQSASGTCTGSSCGTGTGSLFQLNSTISWNNGDYLAWAFSNDAAEAGSCSWTQPTGFSLPTGESGASISSGGGAYSFPSSSSSSVLQASGGCSITWVPRAWSTEAVVLTFAQPIPSTTPTIVNACSGADGCTIPSAASPNVVVVVWNTYNTSAWMSGGYDPQDSLVSTWTEIGSITQGNSHSEVWAAVLASNTASEVITSGNVGYLGYSNVIIYQISGVLISEIQYTSNSGIAIGASPTPCCTTGNVVIASNGIVIVSSSMQSALNGGTWTPSNGFQIFPSPVIIGSVGENLSAATTGGVSTQMIFSGSPKADGTWVQQVLAISASVTVPPTIVQQQTNSSSINQTSKTTGAITCRFSSSVPQYNLVIAIVNSYGADSNGFAVQDLQSINLQSLVQSANSLKVQELAFAQYSPSSLSSESVTVTLTNTTQDMYATIHCLVINDGNSGSNLVSNLVTSSGNSVVTSNKSPLTPILTVAPSFMISSVAYSTLSAVLSIPTGYFNIYPLSDGTVLQSADADLQTTVAYSTISKWSASANSVAGWAEIVLAVPLPIQYIQKTTITTIAATNLASQQNVYEPIGFNPENSSTFSLVQFQSSIVYQYHNINPWERTINNLSVYIVNSGWSGQWFYGVKNITTTTSLSSGTVSLTTTTASYAFDNQSSEGSYLILGLYTGATTLKPMQLAWSYTWILPPNQQLGYITAKNINAVIPPNGFYSLDIWSGNASLVNACRSNYLAEVDGRYCNSGNPNYHSGAEFSSPALFAGVSAGNLSGGYVGAAFINTNITGNNPTSVIPNTWTWSALTHPNVPIPAMIIGESDTYNHVVTVTSVTTVQPPSDIISAIDQFVLAESLIGVLMVVMVLALVRSKTDDPIVFILFFGLVMLASTVINLIPSWGLLPILMAFAYVFIDEDL